MARAEHPSWLKGTIVGVCGALIGVAAYSAGPSATNAASHNVAANLPSARAQDTTLASWLNSQTPASGRNPFVIHLNAFPTTADQAAMEELGKSTVGAADQKKQRPQVLAGIQRAAADLRLASVVMGPTPTAVVNGVSVREGDVVASFRIVRIVWNGIVVEKDGMQTDIALDESNWRRVE
jgi:hypothetical protein